MRKTKIVKIDNKEITVRELRVKDIRQVLDLSDNAATDIMKDAETLLPLATDISLAELEEMAPSEIKVLWDAFKEVNADFLALIERLGITKALEGLIPEHLTRIFADLSSTDTATSGSTDGASL
jgi:hypothetical protein